jgi:hypothetical protein
MFFRGILFEPPRAGMMARIFGSTSLNPSIPEVAILVKGFVRAQSASLRIDK